MSHDYLGAYAADYELGHASLGECYHAALAAAAAGCPRCGKRHASDLERANCSLMEDQVEAVIPRDLPRDIRTCACSHVDDVKYGEICSDCKAWMCERCAPSAHVMAYCGGVLCFTCRCRHDRDAFKAGRRA